jgi:hypothetical protein
MNVSRLFPALHPTRHSAQRDLNGGPMRRAARQERQDANSANGRQGRRTGSRRGAVQNPWPLAMSEPPSCRPPARSRSSVPFCVPSCCAANRTAPPVGRMAARRQRPMPSGAVAAPPSPFTIALPRRPAAGPSRTGRNRRSPAVSRRRRAGRNGGQNSLHRRGAQNGTTPHGKRWRRPERRRSGWPAVQRRPIRWQNPIHHNTAPPPRRARSSR